MPRQLSVRKKIPVCRTCSKCGHQWFFVHEYCGSSGDSFIKTDKEIYAEIESGLDVQAKSEQDKPTIDILCPCCSSLAHEFIKVHFSEGFVKGLKAVYTENFKELIGRIFGSIALTLISLFFIVLGGVNIVFILLSSFCGILMLWFGIGDYMIHASKREVFNWLDTLSEEQAGAVIGELCKKKNHFPSELEWELTRYYKKKIKR